MLARLQGFLSGGAKRLNGNTDLLEGVAAAIVLTGAADGDFDDAEAQTGLDRLLGHDVLSAAFKPNEIEAAFDKQANRARQGLSGKLALKREIADVKGKCSADDCEMLLVIACDVALSDGEVSAPERKALDDIGKSLGLQVDRYLDA